MGQSKPRFIYGLSDPDSGEMRYVGATTDPIKRFRQHYASRHLRGYGQAAEWILELETRGVRPLMTVLEETTADAWPERERHWIDRYRQQGHRLINRMVGGGGPPAMEVGRWAERFEACVECGRTDRIHAADGYCTACYNRLRHRRENQPDRPYYDWSWDYPACVECGTTERKHKGAGLCTNCYARQKRRNRLAA